MSYAKKTLTNNENIVSTMKMSKWTLMTPFIIGIVGAPFTMGITLLLPLWAIVNYLTTEFTVTNKKVLMKTGLIMRKTDELFAKKIEGLDVDQGIIGRIFGFGNVTFTGSGTQKVVFFKIPNPIKAKNDLQIIVA